MTSYSFVKVQSAAVAQVGSTATTNAIAQGGSGQAFANPGQTAYAFSTALPDKAYSATLIDGAHDVASALLGPRDVVFGTAILGANTAADGGGESHTYSASSTFDFGYGGDLMLGLIGSQEEGFVGGAGFQSLEFTIEANGVEILDTTFRSLSIAESFFRDNVIDLGSSWSAHRFNLRLHARRRRDRRLRFRLGRRRRGSRDFDMGDAADRLRRARLCGLSPGERAARRVTGLVTFFDNSFPKTETPEYNLHSRE